MNNYPGGYQIVDFDGLVVADSNLTIKNKQLANTLRECSKPVVFTGIIRNNVKCTAISALTTDTGAMDGKVYNMAVPGGVLYITTDDDNVAITVL